MQFTKTYPPNSAIFIEKSGKKIECGEKVHFCGEKKIYHSEQGHPHVVRVELQAPEIFRLVSLIIAGRRGIRLVSATECQNG